MEKRVNDNEIGPGLSEPLFLFLFALAVRLSLFPYWEDLQLSGDEIYYWTSARVVAGGTLTKNFLHPPLWSYTLSIPASISDNYVYGRLFTATMSSFSVPVIYFLGKCVFNRKVGIAAGLIYAVYPNVIGFSHYLWAESLLALLMMLSTFLFFRALYDEKKQILFYVSCLVSGIGLLVKETALIQFVSVISVLTVKKDLFRRKYIIICAVIIFLTPVIMYSTFASVLARRPVMLADAFVYNSNEADCGKDVFKRSTKENLGIFIDRLFMFREIPVRFMTQLCNLWTPNSFPIFRLLNSQQKYSNVPYASLMAYITAGVYVLVIILGLIGICCAENKSFQVFAVANLLFLSSTGLLFLLCSRFRISFMYIFIIYSSIALSDPKAVLRKVTWEKLSLLMAVLAVFAGIIIVKLRSFGYWG